MVIAKYASKCSGCSYPVCRFCLKKHNMCCPSCNDLFSKKCAICKEIPSIPVMCFLETCKCKNLYCLTCLKDTTGPNGDPVTMKKCLNCQEEFHKNIGGNFYGIPHHNIEFLDAKHGEIFCPRKCGEKMLRVNAQAHLQICPNVKKRFE